MRCSLFGKLAAKRDFIAVSAPREFLGAWEPWMQACVSASRDNLGDKWHEAYLTAPIWRFWLGEEICGSTVAGVVMSSLDGLGRYYPLTLFVYSDQGTTIAPPDLNAHEEWFSVAEDFLLSTLDREVPFETITESLSNLAPPVHHSTAVSEDPNLTNLISGSGMLGGVLEGRSFLELFASLRDANFNSIYAAASFWWTIGGGEFAPFGFSCKRMPDPFIFTAMLTGRFTDAG